MDGAVIFVIVQLIFLEGILSIDNAAVLGAMVAPLPDDKPIPWPRALQRLGRGFDKLLGMQRDAALKIGLLGAYAGRGLMLALAAFVIQNPWLRLIGGLYLLYLALKYLGELGRAAERDSERASVRPLKAGFWQVVVGVELADLAFSLDNVVAAVSLSDRYWVVLLGVAVGIILMRFAASIFSRLISWEPNLETAAYLLVLMIGAELLLDDLFGIHFVETHILGLPINAEAQQFGMTLAILGLTIALARVRWLQPLNIIWRPMLGLCTRLLYPLGWLRGSVGALVSSFSLPLVYIAPDVE
jgi:tellurite resistance protein TerC